MRTLRALLFSPGLLTREWFAGRRVCYIRAFRLYLLCSLLMFGTAIGLRFVGAHWNIGYRPQGALADGTYAQFKGVFVFVAHGAAVIALTQLLTELRYQPA